MPRFSANLWYLFQEFEMIDRFEAAARAGFKGVEFHFPYAWPASELSERLREQGLKQVQINAPPGDWATGDRGLAALPDRVGEFRESIGQAMEYAGALGCELIHVMVGVPGDAESPDCIQETLTENLSYAAGFCEEKGIKVLIEALNPQDVPGYVIGNTAQARNVIETVSHKNLFMQYDLYHAAMNGEDLLAGITNNLDIIGHIQVAGIPGRHEPDEKRDIDYKSLFNAIDALGYGGWIGCEYKPRTGTLEGLGWAKPYGIG